MAKAKGTTVVGAVKLLRSQKEEARAVLPESLHHYLGERIQTAAWYPEADLIGLIRGVLELLPGSRDEALRTMGVATARFLGEGVYSHLMENSGSASTTFALWSTMHDTGTLTSATDRVEREVTFELVDFGHPSQEMCAITTAFIEESMRMSGRPRAIRKVACVLDDDASCTWRAA